MNRLPGAEAICSALAASGVDTVFGVPGTQTVALYEGLRRSGIRTVTASQEMAATFMAQGHYRASGRLAAVSAIPGPGFAFTLAALGEARLDSAALVLLTGSPPTCAQGRRRSQAIDQAAMAGPVVKAVVDIEDPAQVQGAISAACHLALAGEPGPVLVQVASGVYGASSGPEPVGTAAFVPTPQPKDPGLREAARRVAQARRLLVYAGQGAAGCAAELGRIVQALKALVATTPSGRGLVAEDSARLLPLDATGDVAGFNAVIAECDVILVIGAALAENGTGGFRLELPAERLVRVDAASEVLTSPPHASSTVRASAEDFLAAVIEELSAGASSRDGVGFDEAMARTIRGRLQFRAADGPSEARIAGGDARHFFHELRRGIPADGCLVVDSGMHQLLARRHFSATAPRGLLFPSDFQSMAFGLPAAIGARLAQPERAVVALMGDGGLRMTGLELLTAARLGLPIPVVVFDDGALGLIRLDQLLVHGKAHATRLGGLDFEALAQAVGCTYARAGADTIAAEIVDALARGGPTLIVVPVGDAPALTRVRARRRATDAVKALLGERAMAAYRRLRGKR